MVLENLEPKVVWEIFENVFSVTPRESKKEEKIRAKLKTWIPEYAKSQGIEISLIEDETGNILITRPASPGNELVPPLLFQGHMDMVCETDRTDGFDFNNDPIPVRIQDNGEWVDADGTTLGADNGIGVSIALAVLLNPNVKVGKLELLITVDEETGLTGAFALDSDTIAIQSRLLVNVDSGEIGIITVGSAGGGDTTLKREVHYQDIVGSAIFIELSVTGLFGGHSGVDIHKHRGNANKLIARLLAPIVDEMNVHLSKWNGGSKHNAITREATAIFAIEPGKVAHAEELLKKGKHELLSYFKELEPDLEIKWKTEIPVKQVFSLEESKQIIQTIHLIHQGPVNFSPSIKDLVETSNNVAVVETTDSEMRVITSTRSSVDAELVDFRKQLETIGHLTGWDVILKPSYPGWKPNPQSPFTLFIRSQYEKFVDEELKVNAIHAGLECGIIGSKFPGMQMVAIGPDNKNPHTPDEKVSIASVGIIYDLLVSIVNNLPNQHF